MSDQVAVRRAESEDIGRVREVAGDSLTSSYALSPDEIETIEMVAFSEGALTDRLESDTAALFVAEDEETLVGVATCTEEAVDWLHVDPARRGQGAGTALFETAVEELPGDGPARATTLAANTAAGQFFERFDFEQTEERETTFGDLDLAEYVYAPRDAATSDDGQSDGADGTDDDEEEEVGDAVLPTEREDLDLPDEVETEDGTVVLGDESVPGSEGGFVTTYSDADATEAYGYYCVNCGSTDVTADSMDLIECGDCGNTHRPKEDYDASYL